MAARSGLSSGAIGRSVTRAPSRKVIVRRQEEVDIACSATRLRAPGSPTPRTTSDDGPPVADSPRLRRSAAITRVGPQPGGRSAVVSTKNVQIASVAQGPRGSVWEGPGAPPDHAGPGPSLSGRL